VFVYSSGDGLLGYFHLLAIVKNAAVKVHKEICLQGSDLCSVVYIVRREVPGSH
jgi:hypothetical protein